MDNHWLRPLLPIRAVTFEMRFTQSSNPGFFHQAALTAWLRYLLQSPDHYDLFMTIDTPEQGRNHFVAGDVYQFSVIALGEQGHQWLTTLIQLLKVKTSHSRCDARMPFRDNWLLNRVLSWHDGEELSANQDITVLDMAYVEKQIQWLRQAKYLSIRMLSPWRLRREKNATNKALKGEMRFCRDNNHLLSKMTCLWLMRIGDTLRDLLRRQGIDTPPRKAYPDIKAKVDVFWVDSSYQDAYGNIKPMGGLLGSIHTIDVSMLTDELLLSLVLGALIGVGQRRAFGFGRYQIMDSKGKALHT